MMNSAAIVALGLPTSCGLKTYKSDHPGSAKRNKPEEKLSIQITDVDGVHIDDMNIFKSRQSKIRQNLTTQSSSTDD
jgi:hypothetical protein